MRFFVAVTAPGERSHRVMRNRLTMTGALQTAADARKANAASAGSMVALCDESDGTALFQWCVNHMGVWNLVSGGLV